MSASPRNLAWLRGLKIDGVPDFGSRMHELVSDLVNNQNQIAQQTNSSLTGTPTAPPKLQAVTVTPIETGVHISIQHEGEYFQGCEYQGEYADNPHFANPFPFSMGPSREHDLPIGTEKFYYRVFPQYQNGMPGSPVYHGGVTPVAVAGGQKVPRGTSQGSGTGRPGQGLSGYGPVPFRGNNPPKRSA